MFKSVLAIFVLICFGSNVFAVTINKETEPPCEIRTSFGFEALADEVLLIVADKEGFVDSDGIRVHESCLKNFGSEFISILKDARSKGLSCLDDLKGPGSAKNAKLLRELFASKKLRILCNEEDYNWDNAIAYGTIDDKGNKPGLGIIHPSISIGPMNVLAGSKKEGMAKSREFIEATLFHEPFHNIGHAHGTTPDYAYACDECCISYDNIAEKEIACKICKSDYKGVGDPQYIKDLMIFDSTSGNARALNIKMVIRIGLLKNPGSITHLEALNTLLYGDMLGKYFSEELLKDKKYSNNLINKTSKLIFDSSTDGLVTFAREAANIRKLLFVDRDIDKSVQGFLKLEPKCFNQFFKKVTDSQSKAHGQGEGLWNAVLDDMDSLYSSDEFLSHPLKKEFEKKYHEIVNSKPL